MITTLIDCDVYDGCADDVYDYLTEICTDLIKRYGKIVKWGYFGCWDGPSYGGSIIEDTPTLRGHICQDFCVDMTFRLEYTDEEITDAPIQSYCEPTPFKIPQNSLILKQFHHDGTNLYYLRQYEKGDNPKDAVTRDIEMGGTA